MQNFGYLEFHPKGIGKGPLVYPLEKGPTTIGTHISYDIRIKSKTARPDDPILCIIDARDDGVVTLENKSNMPIIYNRKKMKNIRTLKNNDEFEIMGKRFQYISSVVTPMDMDKAIITRARQSVTPNFKMNCNSRIPVLTKRRRSLSAKKLAKNDVGRSCSTASTNKKRNPIFNWQSTQSSDVVAGRSSRTSLLKKSDDLGVQVRRSLFLKNRGDISFSNTIILEKKNLVLNIDGSLSREDVMEKNVKKTPSPRGVKRTRETTSATIDRKNKKRKHDEKLSFSFSIAGPDLFHNSNSSGSSAYESSFESIDKSGSLLDLEYCQKSRGSSILLENESSLNLASSDVSRQSLSSQRNDSLMESVSSRKSRTSVEFGNSGKTSTPKNNLLSSRSSPRTSASLISPRKSGIFNIEKTPRNESVVEFVEPNKSSTPQSSSRKSRHFTNVTNFHCLTSRDDSSVQSFTAGRKTRSFHNTSVVSQNDLLPTLRKSETLKKSFVSAIENDFISPSKTTSPKIKQAFSCPQKSRVSKTVQNSRNVPLLESFSSRKSRTSKAEESLMELFNPQKIRTSSSPNVDSSLEFRTSTASKTSQNDTPHQSRRSIAFKGQKALKSPSLRETSKTECTTSPLRNSPVKTRSSKTPKVYVRKQKVQKSPKNDLTNVSGIQKLLKTPKINKSPKNDVMNVSGVKEIMKSPNISRSPKNDLTNVSGIQKLLKTPKINKSPKNDLTNVIGVKRILRTPNVQKSPKNDLSNVSGVKKIMKTPKVSKSPKNDLTNVSGIQKLMKTPKINRSPKNDLTNVTGMKRILRTPKKQKSPKNDLTDIKGVKKLLQTPKQQKSPLNDLTDVRGVKKLLKTLKIQKSPLNDLSNVKGVKQLLKSPKIQKSPKNDLTDVRGVKKLVKTPKIQNSPKNDLTDVRGVKALLRTFKSPKSPNVSGVEQLFKVEKSPKNNLLDLEVISHLSDVSETKGRKMRVRKVQEKEVEPKITRGRKRKSSGMEDPEEIPKRSRRAVKVTNEDEAVIVVEKQKTTKKGRPRKTTAAVNDDKEQTEVAEVKSLRPKRGRKGKFLDVADDKEQKETVQLKKGRRGKPLGAADDVEEEAVKSMKDRVLEPANEKKQKETTKTKRGRRGKALEVANDKEEKEIIQSIRGRRNKFLDAPHKEENIDTVQSKTGRRGEVPEVSNEDESQQKGSRGQKKTVQGNEIKTDVRVTRSTRRQKHYCDSSDTEQVLNDTSTKNEIEVTGNTSKGGRNKKKNKKTETAVDNAPIMYNTRRRGNKIN